MKKGKVKVKEADNWYYSEDNNYEERNLYRIYAPVGMERVVLKKEPLLDKEDDATDPEP